jgi:hypothetical protein
MSRRKYQDNYGAYELDFTGRDLLQKFAFMVYREYVDGTPIPKKLDGLHFSDFRSKLWWRFFKEYEEGQVTYEFELFDDEWVKPPPDLSRLAKRFSREV